MKSYSLILTKFVCGTSHMRRNDTSYFVNSTENNKNRQYFVQSHYSEKEAGMRMIATNYKKG